MQVDPDRRERSLHIEIRQKNPAAIHSETSAEPVDRQSATFSQREGGNSAANLTAPVVERVRYEIQAGNRDVRWIESRGGYSVNAAVLGRIVLEFNAVYGNRPRL